MGVAVRGERPPRHGGAAYSLFQKRLQKRPALPPPAWHLDLRKTDPHSLAFWCKNVLGSDTYARNAYQTRRQLVGQVLLNVAR